MAEFEPTHRKYTNLNTKELEPSKARSLVEISKELREEAENDILIQERKLQETRLAAERKLQAAQIIDDYNNQGEVPDFVVGSKVESVQGVVLFIKKGDNGTTTVKWDGDDNHTSVVFTKKLKLVKNETLAQAFRRMLEEAHYKEEAIVSICNMVIAGRRKPGAPA